MEGMRNVSCELSLSGRVFKDDSSTLLGHVTHPEGLLQLNETMNAEVAEPAEVNSCLSNSINSYVQSIEDMFKKSRWRVLFTILKIFFTCAYGVCEFILEMALSKWVWNVIWVTSHVIIDVFLHLVLAVSAIMVTVIINMDNGCRRKENELIEYVEYDDDDDDYEDDVESNHGLGDSNQLPCRMKSR